MHAAVEKKHKPDEQTGGGKRHLTDTGIDTEKGRKWHKTNDSIQEGKIDIEGWEGCECGCGCARGRASKTTLGVRTHTQRERAKTAKSCDKKKTKEKTHLTEERGRGREEGGVRHPQTIQETYNKHGKEAKRDPYGTRDQCDGVAGGLASLLFSFT